jgi:hypothetical protein
LFLGVCGSLDLGHGLLPLAHCFLTGLVTLDDLRRHPLTALDDLVSRDAPLLTL